jgi:hypothetical protein|tara:strand:+ start:286 stop:471 length:186 start_codon:yes stop_codon:yes gene_type:complete
MNTLIEKIGRFHSKVFEFLSRKAKTSKFWAILLTFAVLYEIIEHIVWPILVPYLMYMQWFK